VAEGGRVVAAVQDLFFVARIRETADYEALFGAVAGVAPRPTVLAFTTHALASRTKPLHARCDRVVTKETLTAELGLILRGALR